MDLARAAGARVPDPPLLAAPPPYLVKKQPRQQLLPPSEYIAFTTLVHCT